MKMIFIHLLWLIVIVCNPSNPALITFSPKDCHKNDHNSRAAHIEFDHVSDLHVELSDDQPA